MVGRIRSETTGQIVHDRLRSCPPSKPPRARASDDFRRWEIRFDRELKNPGTLKAWEKLKTHDCDLPSLKSTLYHAVECSAGAQEVPRAFRAYLGARETAFRQLTELSDTVREIMELKVGREQVAAGVLFFHGVKKEHVRFFEAFNAQLKRFENVLKIATVPIRETPKLRDLLTAEGEALVHIYLKETTGKLFSAEVALLLEASAEAYGLGGGPTYSTESVNRRFRRFRNRRSTECEMIRQLVSQFKPGGSSRLAAFVNARMIGLFYEVVMDDLED
jgi:hypothetical protein